MNDLKQDSLFAERYKILEKLGSGSIGHAYLTEDAIRKEKVVVRIIFNDLVDDAGGWDSMIPVLRKICSINHQGVMRVYDFNRYQNQVYLTTEHLTGSPLSSIQQDRKVPITQEIIWKWLTQLAEGLVWAEKTMGHLGIKPNNIWIQPDGSTKLTDYGFANLIPLEKRKATAIAQGKATYLPPEIYDGSDWDAFAVDQYALGQVIQELALEIRSSSRLRNPIKNPSLHQLTEVTRTLTQRDPRDRYLAIEALRKAIQTGSLPQSPSRDVFQKSIIFILKWKRTLLAFSLGAALLATATYLMPARNHYSQIQEHNLRELSELRTIWNTYHQERMTLLARLPKNTPETKTLWKAIDPVNEIDWIAELESLNRHRLSWKAARFSSALRRLNQTLNKFRETLRLVTHASDTLRELRRLKSDLAVIKQQRPDSPQSSKFASDKAIPEIEKMLTRQLFSRASKMAQSSLIETKNEIDQIVHDFQTRALESQSRWHTNLKNAQVPVLDPSAEPSNKIQDAIRTHETGNWTQALDRHREASEIYDRWSRHWEATPPPAPEHWVNSLGMRFITIGDQMISIWETRFLDFAFYVEATGADTMYAWREAAAKPYAGPLHPVCSIDDSDAHGFCEWLTAREQGKGLISTTQTYRLPTDREWSLIAGLEYEEEESPKDRHLQMQDHWPWQNPNLAPADRGNYFTFPHASEDNNFFGSDPYLESSPVGSFPPNSSGIYDLGGNVWEFTASKMMQKHLERTNLANTDRAIRGASWRTVSLEAMRTSFRLGRRGGREDIGFRCILSPIQTDSAATDEPSQ